jgi:predicted HicB family RNase H-like nuclease
MFHYCPAPAAKAIRFGLGRIQLAALRATETDLQIVSQQTLKRTTCKSTSAMNVMPIFLPRKGLQLPPLLPFQKWLGIGRQLADICTLSAWCLGDWLVYGEVAYTGRYRDAIEQTSLDYQTLRNYAWVAKRFSISRRREALSFGHHAEVAALSEPEQDFWLRKAEELGWSVKRLRQEVRASLKERSQDQDQDHEHSEVSDHNAQEWLMARVEIHISSDQLKRCQAAAERAGLSMEEWATSVLERAARSALDNST